ncbi:CPBP family intramembrane glutamic endopeptidase [Urechidicola vernalis]|uniref:CPBP family intramembrane glutamic endopeptidase n=1 Tax=Urechidicola vernalis TaxID=3075600 RepID=A0ABU2Y3I8_9FLAO|nr:CPBP family intramembrane glutamic endopeptidase [Urechidicola sp. P050]MDT0552774.1 CPBP family intramembrane glutamic endopeptidase [Urechidicola sp. P050]
MLGLLGIIVVSWGLLYFFEKKQINALGFTPIKKRFKEFTLGLVIIGVITLTNIYFATIFKQFEWQINGSFSLTDIGNSFIYHLRSALTEDLVFRGAILYILIQKIGASKGIWLSAFIFGIYHIFSYGMLNERIVPIVYITIVTGLTGYVWAYTFYKTKSIMMGLGFHLGSNFITTLFYKSQPYGELLFTKVAQIELSEWNQFYVSLLNGLFPSITTLIIVIFLLKKEIITP